MSSSEPFLLILKNGPIHGIDDYVGYQLEVLSRRFRGELWVTGSFGADETIGRFRLRVVPETAGNRWAFFARYRRSLLQRAVALDRAVTGPKAVLTYDPFKNGLLGRQVKRAVGWPLIVEVNGAYGNPDNFADSQGFVGTRLKPALMRALGRYVISGADGVRLLYDEQLQDFATPADGTVIRQYFDAVPLERFVPRPEEPMLLHLGYPYRRKGVDLLLAAFQQLRGDFPEWRLVLIGHELGKHVPQALHGVKVLPGINNKQAAEWIGRCAVLVLASRSEAMGRVLIEAAAAGKPRVAARVDGTYTVVSHESDGLLFEKGSVESLAAALRRLMADPDLRQHLGATARQRAFAEFGADQYVERVYDLATTVLRQRG